MIMKKVSVKESVKELVWICGVLLAMTIFEEFEI